MPNDPEKPKTASDSNPQPQKPAEPVVKTTTVSEQFGSDKKTVDQ